MSLLFRHGVLYWINAGDMESYVVLMQRSGTYELMYTRISVNQMYLPEAPALLTEVTDLLRVPYADITFFGPERDPLQNRHGIVMRTWSASDIERFRAQCGVAIRRMARSTGSSLKMALIPTSEMPSKMQQMDSNVVTLIGYLAMHAQFKNLHASCYPTLTEESGDACQWTVMAVRASDQVWVPVELDQVNRVPWKKAIPTIPSASSEWLYLVLIVESFVLYAPILPDTPVTFPR